MKATILLPICLLASACSGARWSERAANDRIMLVRESPVTLGFHRLEQHAASHPDFAVFLGKQGRPDFIAETHSDDRHYMILYYLDGEAAYAARSWRAQSV
ncbi:MAG: hypothetical protein ACQKBU_11205, partial [Verrucomicrobiales bacterium]